MALGGDVVANAPASAAPKREGSAGVTVLLFLLGLILVFLVSPLVEWLRGRFAWGPRPSELIVYGAEHLGVVIIVALMIRETLERSGQKQFINVVNTEVRHQIGETLTKEVEKSLKPLRQSVDTMSERFSYKIDTLYGDKDLGQMLKDLVFNPKFVRPQYTLTLKLEPLPSKGGEQLLKATVTTEFQVKNTTEDDLQYPILIWLDDIIRAQVAADATPGFRRVAVGIDEKPRELDINALKNNQDIVNVEGQIRLNMNSSSMRPHQVLSADVEGVQLMRAEDHFVWNLVTVTESLTLIIELAGGITFKHFDVFPRAMHHMDNATFLASSNDKDPVRREYRIKQVVLPFQGVEIRWRRHAQP